MRRLTKWASGGIVRAPEMQEDGVRVHRVTGLPTAASFGSVGAPRACAASAGNFTVTRGVRGVDRANPPGGH